MKSKDYIEELNKCCYRDDFIKLFAESIYEILKEMEDSDDNRQNKSTKNIRKS